MDEQPKPAEPAQRRKKTPAEERAEVRRTNAFMELNKLLQQAAGPAIAIAQVQLKSGEQIVVHASPGGLSEMVMLQQQTIKQMETALNVLLDLLLNDQLTAVNFMDRCAQAAEQTASVIRRGILSQGAQAGGIIRPQ